MYEKSEKPDFDKNIILMIVLSILPIIKRYPQNQLSHYCEKIGHVDPLN